MDRAELALVMYVEAEEQIDISIVQGSSDIVLQQHRLTFYFAFKQNFRNSPPAVLAMLQLEPRWGVGDSLWGVSGHFGDFLSSVYVRGTNI